MSTSENNKRIAKNTILLYFRMLFTMGISFYASRIILNALGVVDYGIYYVVGGISALFSVLNDSMSGATQRFITIAIAKKNEAYLNKVFAVGMTAQLVIAFLVLILCESAGVWFLYNYAVIPPERLNVCFWIFQISILTTIIDIINVPFRGAIMAHEKMGILALFSMIDAFIKLLICFVIYWISYDKLIIYASLLFAGCLINFALMQIYCHKKFTETRLKLGWDKIMYKEMCNLAMWTISSNIATIGYTQGITVLINMFYGPVMNAAVGVAGQAGNIVNQFSGSFQTAINPQITKTYATHSYSEMHKLIYRSAKFSYFLMLLFSIPLFCEANLLLRLWLIKVPEHSVSFLRIGLFISMLMTIRNPLVTSAIANGHLKKYQSVIVSILMLVCPISYLVLKLGGIPESPSVTLLCIMFIAVLASAFMLKNMIHFNFNDFLNQVMYKILLVTALSFILPLIIIFTMDESIVRLVITTIVSTTITTYLIYIIGLTSSERTIVVSIVKSKLRKYIKNKI